MDPKTSSAMRQSNLGVNPCGSAFLRGVALQISENSRQHIEYLSQDILRRFQEIADHTSYRTPVGRLASLGVGGDLSLPNGTWVLHNNDRRNPTPLPAG